MPEDIRRFSIPAGTSNFVEFVAPTDCYFQFNLDVAPSSVEIITPEGITMSTTVGIGIFGYVSFVVGFPLPIKYQWKIRIYGNSSSAVNGFLIFFW